MPQQLPNTLCSKLCHFTDVLHVRPANRRTITGVALRHTKGRETDVLNNHVNRKRKEAADALSLSVVIINNCSTECFNFLPPEGLYVARLQYQPVTSCSLRPVQRSCPTSADFSHYLLLLALLHHCDMPCNFRLFVV
jgi:hypothetical protein